MVPHFFKGYIQGGSPRVMGHELRMMTYIGLLWMLSYCHLPILYNWSYCRGRSYSLQRFRISCGFARTFRWRPMRGLIWIPSSVEINVVRNVPESAGNIIFEHVEVLLLRFLLWDVWHRRATDDASEYVLEHRKGLRRGDIYCIACFKHNPHNYHLRSWLYCQLR